MYSLLIPFLSLLASPQSAERAYANIALAYDRFLKAGDLYKAYDPITSTEPFYANIPTTEAIKYDSNGSPKVADQVRRTAHPSPSDREKDKEALTVSCGNGEWQIVVLGGPDKGKTGKLIGIDDTKGVIKLDTNGKFTEVKMISMKDIGKQLQSEI